MPRGHEHDPMYSHQYSRALVMGKKDRCAVFECNNDRVFASLPSMAVLVAK